jgi:hypothetical protein
MSCEECNNESDPITLEDLKEVPAEFLFKVKDDKVTHCFDIRSLYKYYDSCGKLENPLTRTIFSEDTLNLFLKRVIQLGLTSEKSATKIRTERTEQEQERERQELLEEIRGALGSEAADFLPSNQPQPNQYHMAHRSRQSEGTRDSGHHLNLHAEDRRASRQRRQRISQGVSRIAGNLNPLTGVDSTTGNSIMDAILRQNLDGAREILHKRRGHAPGAFGERPLRQAPPVEQPLRQAPLIQQQIPLRTQQQTNLHSTSGSRIREQPQNLIRNPEVRRGIGREQILQRASQYENMLAASRPTSTGQVSMSRPDVYSQPSFDPPLSRPEAQPQPMQFEHSSMDEFEYPAELFEQELRIVPTVFISDPAPLRPPKTIAAQVHPTTTHTLPNIHNQPREKEKKGSNFWFLIGILLFLGVAAWWLF